VHRHAAVLTAANLRLLFLQLENFLFPVPVVAPVGVEFVETSGNGLANAPGGEVQIAHRPQGFDQLDGAVVEVAELLELAPAEVQDTLTFYGFFKQDRPHGEVRAWVCRSISCALRGGEEVLEHMCDRLGIKPGETTDNGKLTLEFGECLGACEYAPCMLAGADLHRDLTNDTADKFLNEVGCEIVFQTTP
jgi:NADH-quinone oxidoreductase subunit E